MSSPFAFEHGWSNRCPRVSWLKTGLPPDRMTCGNVCFVNCCLYYLSWAEDCFLGKEQPVCFVLVFRTIDMFLWCHVSIRVGFLALSLSRHGLVTHAVLMHGWLSASMCRAAPRLARLIHSSYFATKSLTGYFLVIPQKEGQWGQCSG